MDGEPPVASLTSGGRRQRPRTTSRRRRVDGGEMGHRSLPPDKTKWGSTPTHPTEDTH